MRPITPTLVILLIAVLSGPGTGGAQSSSAEAQALPTTIPIFPLQDVMLFPHSTRALHIFEPRYRAMVADALEGDSIIGMILLQPGYETEYEGRPPVYAVGCAGVIIAVEELPEEQREVFLLKEVSGLKFREIADVVGAPVPTVKSRMRYALEALRGHLAQYEDIRFDEEERVEVVPGGE